MRIRSSIISLILCVSFADVASAYLSSERINLGLNQIKPNLVVRSKPTYPKYASVSFLRDDTSLDFKPKTIDVKTQCATLGYVIPVSKCSAPMQPSYLCGSETSMAGVKDEANQYTSGCCNSNLYTADTMDACGNNSTALNDSCYFSGEKKKKYRCSCDRSRYPYSDLPGEGCGSNGSPNVNNKCQAPDASGNIISYYASCCPSSYTECDGSEHLVGKGNSCRVQDGSRTITKYEFCECSSSYDTQCATMMIDASDTCTDSHGTFTRDLNCESGCSQSAETNLDNYFYGNTWHCLYKKDGATVKSDEGALCKGYKLKDNILTQEDNHYDECEAQGYVKAEGDCADSHLILRCPNNIKKVWCLDGTYCSGFDVGDIKVNNETKTACNNGAKITECGSHEQGTRCRYQNEECNKCWENGVYDATKCSNLDTSDKGDSEKCCKRGYVMENGICKANKCDKDLYPYTQNPGDDQGELEICYEADENVSIGYRPYFGYSRCYDNADEGGQWTADSENPRKCICDRYNDARGRLPFDVLVYYDANIDRTNNYVNIGFNAGSYGMQTSCTDSEGSYYGYKSCYIGTETVTAEAARGMCLRLENSGRFTTHPYWISTSPTQILGYVNLILRAAGVTPITAPAYPIVKNLPDKSKVFCVNKETHCPEGTDPANVEEGSACDLARNPVTKQWCMDGTGEDCNYCYHIASLTRDGNGVPIKTDGKYTWNDKFRLVANTFWNGSITLGFETCPDGLLGGNKSYYGGCFKRCSVSNLSECNFMDIVTDANNKDVGVVAFTKSSAVYVFGLYQGSGDWSEANSYVNAYDGKGSSDPTFGAGKWRLPTDTELSKTNIAEYSLYTLRSAYKYLRRSEYLDDIWTSSVCEGGHNVRKYSMIVGSVDTLSKNIIPFIKLDK